MKCLARLVSLLTVLLLGASSAAAQDATAAPAASFDSIESCRTLADGLAAVNEDSKQLDAVMPLDESNRDAFLSAVFQGTKIMLSFGEQMFTLSDQHEEKCKAALREAGAGGEVVRIYELALEPTARGYAYLLRVRDVAAKLGDKQTFTEMEDAAVAYRSSALRLVDFCETELGEGDKAPCAELRRRIEVQMP